MADSKAVQAFLQRHRLDGTGTDPVPELEKLLKEMDEAYHGKDRSVKMIPCYIEKYRTPKQETQVTVVDIGGTNVRSAVVTMGADGSCLIEDRRSFPRPGGSEPMSTARFFDEIAQGMRGQFNTEKLGICFSLATIPQPDKDAVIVAGGKQIRIHDMLGKKVGASFREAALRTGAGSAGAVAVVNDTVAATLGGASFHGKDDFAEDIGFIYGTGVNICYAEPDGMLVNTEAGAYSGFPAGDLDDAYDSTLIDPGLDRFEKMVSGGYQGGLARTIMAAAAREGFLTGKAFENNKEWENLESRDISAFCNAPSGGGRIARACAAAADREFLLALFSALTDRSARLCGIALTAAMIRSLCGTDPCAASRTLPRFHITAEGSTYQKQHGFAERLDVELKALATQKYGFHYTIEVVPDAVLRGIAAACLG